MKTQPEALRLADALMEPVVLDKHAMQAAAELRRLHAVNEELLELLIEAREELKVEPEMFEFVSRIDAAIAKAGG